MKITKTSEFYKEEVILWRGRGALFWALLLIPCCCVTLITAINFSLSNPYLWISGTMWTLLSPVTFFYIICMCIVYTAMMTNRTKFFSVIPEIQTSKWSTIRNILQPKRLQHVIIYTVGTSFICWFLLQILGGDYKPLVITCKTGEKESCLNEAHLFVLFNSIFIGFCGSLKFFSSNQNFIHYPIIQQSKWRQNRSDFGMLLVYSATFVLSKMKYYYLSYYLITGAVIKYCMESFFSLHVGGTEQIDSFYRLLDLQLFLVTWISATIVHFFSSAFTALYVAYQTQPFEFLIQCTSEEDETRKLIDALACDSVPLLQYQGFQDLCLLAKHSFRRRQELFSLSALGGHAYNWQSISAECIASLKQFLSDIAADNARTVVNGSVRHLQNENYFKDSDVTCRKNASTVTKYLSEIPNKEESKHIGAINSRTIRSAHLLETNYRTLLGQSQKHIWNIEALSHIITASYTEDHYGVVQKSFPEIITIFVTLQEEVEKMIKLAGSVAKSGFETDLEIAIHLHLRVTLKSAIYNVCSIFGNHIESLDISNEVKKRLLQYVEYRI